MLEELRKQRWSPAEPNPVEREDLGGLGVLPYRCGGWRQLRVPASAVGARGQKRFEAACAMRGEGDQEPVALEESVSSKS